MYSYCLLNPNCFQNPEGLSCSQKRDKAFSRVDLKAVEWHIFKKTECYIYSLRTRCLKALLQLEFKQNVKYRVRCLLSLISMGVKCFLKLNFFKCLFASPYKKKKKKNQGKLELEFLLNPKSYLLTVIPVGYLLSKTGLEVTQSRLCKICIAEWIWCFLI